MKKSISEYLWDVWCLISCVGIWPRFIEPNLLKITKRTIPIQDLPQSLTGLKIVQISDLHLNDQTPRAFIKKLTRKIHSLSPDLIVFTGDFLCYAELKHPELLKKILCSLRAPHGCYAVLGNHDYAEFVSINAQGEYDLVNHSSPTIIRAFKRLFSKIDLKGLTTHKVKTIPIHGDLSTLIKETPFKLLHNECITLPIKGSFLNLCGLGEYTLGRCLPEEAFKNYQNSYPGIILSHNPDSLALLKNFPGNLILSGHTHGGQINLPGLWKKFTLLENPQLKRGLVNLHGKQIYINRGLGSVMRFRWFAAPEITEFTLESL